MGDSSENDTCITISSDNCSPIKPSNKNKREVQDSNCSSIVVSDTELEEGEISANEEKSKFENEEKQKFENEEKPELIEINSSVKIGNEKLASGNETCSSSNSSSIKRKLSEHFESNKKGKYNEIPTDKGENNLSFTVEEFPWSELKVLAVGDERVKNLDWKEWNEMPILESSFTKHCDLETVCNLVEKNLHKEYDIVLVFAFHHDFVNVNENFFSETNDKIFMDLKSDVNIIKMLNTVEKYHSKWEKQFPNTYVIWTLPYPPDFLKINSVALKGKNVNLEKALDEKSQNELTKNYYALAKKFLKDWKTNNKSLPIFPLNKVLFIKKHCYKKTFEGSGTPKFPKGYLIDGFYPSKLMILYIAYLFIEFLVDYEFYPENQFGLDLKDMEAKLEEIDPLYKNFFHTDKNSGSHKRSKGHSHHSRKRKKSSLSSPYKHSRSHSRSRRRRSRSSSRGHRKHHLSSRRKRRSYSRSRSGSLNKRRKAHSKSSSTKRSSSKSRYSQSNKHLSSLSPSSSTSSSSVITENQVTTYVKEDKDSKEEEEEVSFFKTLRYLREVHEIQCSIYRKKPHTHPLYDSEKEKFLKKQNNKLPEELHMPKWKEFWKQKMEKIFHETWCAKKEQLTIDLNKKGSFTSLHNVNSNKNNLANVSSAATNLNDGQQLEEKESKSISSFLNNFDCNLQLKKQPTENLLNIKKLEDYALADIFKDTCSHDIDLESKINIQAETSHSLTKNNIISNCPNLKAYVPDNSQLDSDSESGNESIKFDDSDLDVDEIMGNPDFIQGLDEISKELENVVPSEKDKKESPTLQTASSIPTSSTSLQSDLSFLFRNKNEEKKECSENLKEEFGNVLKMLFRVSKRLGPLGLSVSALYHRATEDLKNNKERFPSLNSDSKALLVLVEKKLNSFLKENLPQVQKAIYGEIAERLHSLLQKVDVEEKCRFPKVNVASIAAATVGQQLKDVIAFIKNTLLYHGYTDYTNDDVMNIYMSVKASQLDMEKG